MGWKAQVLCKGKYQRGRYQALYMGTGLRTENGWVILSSLLKIAGVALLYVLAGVVTDRYFSSIGIIPTIWPSAGIAMAALLIGGVPYAWSVLLGTIVTDLIGGSSLDVSIGDSLAHVTQGLVGFWLLTANQHLPYPLKSLRDYIRLILLGAVASNAVAAVVSAPFMLSAHTMSAPSMIAYVFHHWEDDIIGVALITPFMLVHWNERFLMPQKINFIKNSLLIVAIFLVGQFVFIGWGSEYFRAMQYGYWLFFFVTWTAICAGARGVTLVLLIITIQAMMGAAQGTGFFAQDIANSGLQNCMAYLMVLSTVGIALATYASEAREREDSLRIASIAFDSQEGILIADAAGNIIKTNHAFRELTGYTQDEIVGKNFSMIRSERHDADFYANMWSEINTTGSWSGEIWNRRKSGDVFPAYLTITAVTNQEGIVTNYVGAFNDITEQKRLSEIIWHQAHFDQLTGLPNRSLLFDRLSEKLSQARRSNRMIALLFIDLDGFKAINDNYGHDAGNVVLKTVAQRFLQSVRAVDTVSRLGGDEFVVVCDDLDDQSGAVQIAEKLIGSLAPVIAIPGGQTCKVGASIGISLYPTHAVEIDSLLSTADSAMYDSKTRGGNSYTFTTTTRDGESAVENWIVFNDSHIIGVSEIDQQHRKLVEIINQLNRAIIHNTGNDEIKELFDGLIEFVVVHFETELRFMQQYDFPYMAPHDSAHNHLICVLVNFSRQIHLGKDLLALQSIKDWLIDHIKNEDKLLGAFLMLKGVT